MVGILCCGIGAGVMFQEYSSFKYMGEKELGDGKIEEKTLTKKLYTDKTKKLNTSFITYNQQDGKIKIKTSKKIPEDKVQIKIRYNANNVENIHIDQNLYNDDEYGDAIYTDDGYAEENVDVSEDKATGKQTKQQFFISAVSRLSGPEYILTYKDEILKNIKERKLYNYVYPQIISVEITVNPINKGLVSTL